MDKQTYNFIDLAGRVFGRWVVLDKYVRQKGRTMWLCRCECGTEKLVDGTSLRGGISKGCGCLRAENNRKLRFVSLLNKTFGRWTVISLASPDLRGHGKWLCRCECGNEKIVSSMTLVAGSSKSCGCLRTELAKSRVHVYGKRDWKRGKRRRSGYILIFEPDHPNAGKNGYVSEHIVVMSGIIGRPLTKKETVHHRNGIRDDNEPSNLELWASGHPRGQRITDLIPYWKKMLELYEPIIGTV